ncbi:MAG: hypothetical protein ACI9FR_000925 [Cryomorphaceae bacterium]|jgi:hypothetical protein
MRKRLTYRAILLREKPNDWVTTAKASQAEIVAPYFEEITADCVRLMQNGGQKAVVWAPNSEHQSM